MNYFVINADFGSFAYFVSYHAAISAFLFIAWMRSSNKSKKNASFLFFLLSIVLSAVIGSRLFSISANQWYALATHAQDVPIPGRSALGALLGAVILVLIWHRQKRIENDWWNALSFATPIAFAIQRFGCLIHGCCYGNTCDYPWAIQYGKNSIAFAELHANHILNSNATLTNPLHPVALYEIAAWLILAIFAYFHTTQYTHKPLWYLIVAAGLGIRFGAEFVRFSDKQSLLQHEHFGLKNMQWLLIAGIVASSLLYIKTTLTKDIRSKGLLQQSLLFIFLLLVFRHVFEPLEYIVCLGFYGLFSLHCILTELRTNSTMSWAGVVGMYILLCSQQVPFFPFKPASDSTNSNYEIHIGLDMQQSDFSYTHTNYCSNVSQYYHQSGTAVGMQGSISSFYQNNKYRLNYSAGLYNVSFNKLHENDNTRSNYNALTGYGAFQFDSRRVGITGGIIIPTNIYNEPPSSFPIISLRYGNPNVFYVSIHSITQLLDMSPYYSPSIEIGTQFNTDNILCKLGLNGQVVYLHPEFKVKGSKMNVSPYLGVPSNNEIQNGIRLGLQIRYRL